MGWDDALLIHRAAENYQGVALMVRDPVLMSLAAAWPQVKRRKVGDLPKRSLMSSQEIIEAMWRETSIDFDDWAQLAQVEPLHVHQGYRALRGNGIILPDGTLNHLADSVLKKEAAGQLLNQFGIKPGEMKK
jgi:hypothetical protein